MIRLWILVMLSVSCGDNLGAPDVDECAAATDDCDPNATCANTAGSFTCTCNTGYTGDGISCTDVDECASGNPCDANATCVNTPGSFACACSAGYVGDGVSCADIDECATGANDCHAHATCTNTPGSFGCTCKVGYAGDGVACIAELPRPISPLSTSIVTSRRPTLRWVPEAETDGTVVELCSDRPCTIILATLDVTGSTAAPAVDLPSGVVYWRLHGRSGATVDPATSSTWQFTVGTRSAPIDTSWGTVLDVNGDGFGDIAVGAPGANGNSGRVHVFHGGPTGLTTTPATSVTAPDGGQFGDVVASAGDINGDGYADVIVGAPRSGNDVGTIYVYLGGAAGLASSPVSTRVGPDGDGGLFGTTVASVGDINGDGYADVAVGAVGTANYTGAVYIYLGGPDGLDSSYATSFTGPDGAGGYFGSALASAGDLDGDGHPDVAIGAPWPLDIVPGHVYVYMGGASGLTTPPIRLVDPATTVFGFGAAITAGDFDGDGYADLVIGEPRSVLVNVYRGGSSGIAADPTIQLTRGASEFGASVAAVGDVDGDGYADLAIGDPESPDSSSSFPIGATYIYFGGVSAWSTSVILRPLFPDAIYSSFGCSVAGAADVDGDGYADVVVGALGQDPNSTGDIYIFHGKSGSIATTWSPELAGPDGDDGEFGTSVY